MDRARLQRDSVVQQMRTLFALGTIEGMTDGRLLERFTTCGDESAEAAFSVLVERHGPMVLRVCRSVLRDQHDAEDAFQATFLVMVRRARSLWVRDSIGPWLYQVAHRTATRARTIETQRRRREHKAAVGLSAEVQNCAPDDLDEALHEEIARLPERYRAAVVVCLLEGLPNEQAARRLGWPVGTVQSRLARGRARLKQSLTRRGLAPTIAVGAASAVSPRLADAALQSALRYAAPSSQAAAISSSIVALTEGVLRMMMLAKWKTGLLAFATVGGLGLATVAVPHSIGAAGQEPSKVQVPKEGAPKPAEPPAAKEEPKPPAAESKTGDVLTPAVPPEPPVKIVPSPNESTVQIEVGGFKVEGENIQAIKGEKPVIASGTVISSTPKETIILTYARIFPPEEAMITVKFCVDEVSPPKATIPYSIVSTDRTPGELIDRDLMRNVALVRIRPGRTLPASPIVPRNWRPQVGMTMTSMQGSSERRIGKFADVPIVDLVKGEGESAGYEAIVCSWLPKQIVLGSGLFTQGPPDEENRLAGVCNFADPARNTGLFAAANMIYPILDRNGLSSLYQQDQDPRLSVAPAADFPLRSIEPTGGVGPIDESPTPVASPADPPKEVEKLVRRAAAPKESAERPWSTTVRIKIDDDPPKQALGTIIKSTPDEAIILTCASIFYFEGSTPRRRSISVDLLDGLLDRFAEDAVVSAGRRNGPLETLPGKAIDADSARNVALIRIHPGRQGPAAQVVARGWAPRKNQKMLFWNIQDGFPASQPTTIIEPRFVAQRRSLRADHQYEAVVCQVAPKRWAVGGGLFIQEAGQSAASYLVGVCNYAAPDSDEGYYADPQMIYPILDKNGLTDVYRSNDAMNLAPRPEFSGGPAPAEEPAPAGGGGPSDVSRLRAVEQRIDALDGKLDEVLRLLKKPD